MWVTWNLKGAALDLDTYLRYPNRRRELIRREINRRIEQHNSMFDED